MARNPFYIHQPARPEDFVGREKVVSEIVNDLHSAMPHSWRIIGGRRFGKSSLLVAIEHELKQHLKKQAIPNQLTECVVPVRVSLQAATCANIEGVFGFLAHELQKVLCGKVLPPPFTSERLIDIGLPTYKANTPSLLSFAEFEQLLIALIASAYEKCWLLHLVILIDELEVILDRTFTSELLGNLRSLINDSAVKGYLSYVMAGSRRFEEAAERGSSLLNVLEVRYLERLADADIQKLITRATFSIDLSRQIMSIAGGHPFIAQCLLERLFLQHKALNEAAVKDIVTQICSIDQLNNLNAWWSSGLTDDSRYAYTALCNLQGWVTIAELRNYLESRLSKSHFDTQKAMITLIYHGFVLHNGRGAYCVNPCLFQDWSSELRQTLHTHATPKAQNTANNTAVQGNVQTGRDFVGRDVIVNHYYAANPILTQETDIRLNTEKASRLAPVFEAITEKFSSDEFKELCFLIGVTYDHLRGDNYRIKVLELILALDRQEDQLEVLIDRVRELRPNLSFG